MAKSGAYFDVLDWLDRQEKLEPSAFLRKLQTAYAVGPVTYLDAAINNGRLRALTIHHSIPRDTHQVSRTLQRRAGGEQILRVFAALEPVQLDPWMKPGKLVTGSNAIVAYPLPTLPGRHSCLMVQLDLPQSEIDQWRRVHDRDLLSLGAKLNARVARSVGIEHGGRSKSLPLTRRERETLAWIAAGKSYWETAVILGISERTIRYFMANARQKLDVVNNAQAVAEAAWRGLIPRLSDPQAL
jgi:LuxR family transcriptional regulator, quorum-sensing system regulator SinR